MSDAGAGLRLKAEDAEDLKAISAVTQDALVPVHDMAYLPEERRFVIALNRFRWETAVKATDGVYERVNCGLRFENVTRVELRGIDLKQREFILDLLSISCDGNAVMLSFAGGRDLRITTDRLDCRLDDFGEPWPTKSRPDHAIEKAWAEWEAEFAKE